MALGLRHVKGLLRVLPFGLAALAWTRNSLAVQSFLQQVEYIALWAGLTRSPGNAPSAALEEAAPHSPRRLPPRSSAVAAPGAALDPPAPASPAEGDVPRRSLGGSPTRRRPAAPRRPRRASKLEDVAALASAIAGHGRHKHEPAVGGTSLCGCGKSSGCKTSTGNCNVDGTGIMWEGGFRSLKLPQECDAFSAAVGKLGFKLQGNENYLLQGRVCRQFWNVIAFRDPVDRVLSHLSFCGNRRSNWCLHGFDGWLNNATPEWLLEHRHVISDNYFIRTLLGGQVYNLPAGGINSTHLEMAVHVLYSFDAVLDFDEEFLGTLRTALGWTCKYNPYAKRQAGHGEDAVKTLLLGLWGEAGLARMRWLNRFDIALREQVALPLARLDRRIFDHPAFAAASAAAGCREQKKCGHFCSR